MLQALIASAGRAVAGAVAEGAVAEGAATAAKATPVETAKKLLSGGSNHNSPPDQGVQPQGGQSEMEAVGSSFGKALASTGPGTDLSGGNSLYRSF